MLLLPAPWLFSQEVPKVDGYLSRLESQTSFEVDGRRVEMWERTTSFCANPRNYPPASGPSTFALGDHLVVYGTYDKKRQAVRASAVCKYGLRAENVSGAAVLEKVDGSNIVADGRVLVVEPTSTVKAEGTRHSMADAQVNDWVRYSATTQPDGRYVVREITIAPNTASPLEAKLRNAKFLEFTPPDPAPRHDGEIKFGHLSHRYKLPAGEQLERVARLGSTLIPPYQRALAADDPVRIDFHFYVIDGLKTHSCLSTPNGYIFMPSSLLSRLPEDADLAAILATCVADLVEKQAVMLIPKAEGNTAALTAGVAAGLFVPGLGLAAIAGNSIYGSHLEEQLQHQSARVSLDLLAAAGYSPALAPHAEELAEAKHLPLKMNDQPSERAGYLYQALAEREPRGSAGSAFGSTGGW